MYDRRDFKPAVSKDPRHVADVGTPIGFLRTYEDMNEENSAGGRAGYKAAEAVRRRIFRASGSTLYPGEPQK